MNVNTILEYLSIRPVVNIDSFYRVRGLDISDRAQAVDILQKYGYLIEGKKALRKETFNPLVYASPDIVVLELPDPVSKVIKDKKLLVVTSYLTKTFVNKPFWDNLLAYVRDKDADLIVIPHRYYNPTSLKQQIKDLDETWIDPVVVPYLSWEKQRFGDIDIRSDVRINPSNISPLSPLKSTWERDTIYGHVTQQLLAQSNSVYQQSNIGWTTGTVSDVDVADNVVAKRSEFHMRFGFIVTDGINSRNVHASKDGTFSDLDQCYKEGICYSNTPESIVYGDVHVGNHDQEALDWAIAITEDLTIVQIILHDFFDGSTVNPHVKSKSDLYQGYDSLKDEIGDVCSVADHIRRQTKSLKLSLVSSNHHDFISRFFDNVNITQLSKSDKRVLERYLSGGVPSVLLHDFDHLHYDAKIGKIYIGRHGHRGSNGAKGSCRSDFLSGQRQISGHSHSPEILGGAERVGCLCKLVQPYNKDQSSNWCHSVALIQGHSKIQHLIKRRNSNTLY